MPVGRADLRLARLRVDAAGCAVFMLTVAVPDLGRFIRILYQVSGMMKFESWDRGGEVPLAPVV